MPIMPNEREASGINAIPHLKHISFVSMQSRPMPLSKNDEPSALLLLPVLNLTLPFLLVTLCLPAGAQGSGP